MPLDDSHGPRGEPSPRQERVDELMEAGHSLAYSLGATWAEHGNTAPLPEHGVDDPGLRPRPRIG